MIVDNLIGTDIDIDARNRTKIPPRDNQVELLVLVSAHRIDRNAGAGWRRCPGGFLSRRRRISGIAASWRLYRWRRIYHQPHILHRARGGRLQLQRRNKGPEHGGHRLDGVFDMYQHPRNARRDGIRIRCGSGARPAIIPYLDRDIFRGRHGDEFGGSGSDAAIVPRTGHAVAGAFARGIEQAAVNEQHPSKFKDAQNDEQQQR